MSEKLIAVCDFSMYRLQWDIKDGAYLGEGGSTLAELKSMIKRAPAAEKEVYAAAIAVLEMNIPPDSRDSYGFGWATKSAALKSLEVANAAIQVIRDNRPLPSWAKKALAEGWKMPKGWKP